MSELISRSELLKRFLVNKDGHRIPERDCDNIEVTVSIKDVKTIIKEQPTAYNIDKIVEELEKREEHYVEMLDWLCEWIKQYKNYDWQPSCETNSVYNVAGVGWFKFCPYCGKKIMVVE